MVDYRMLHPKVQGAFQHFSDELFRLYLTGEGPCWFKAFEGYRSPQRQLELYQTSRGDGSRVTNAKPFESAHQYGLAVDYVPFVVRDPREVKETAQETTQGSWKWDVDDSAWDWFDSQVKRAGLYRTIRWDRPHVTHLMWEQIKGRFG